MCQRMSKHFRTINSFNRTALLEDTIFIAILLIRKLRHQEDNLSKVTTGLGELGLKPKQLCSKTHAPNPHAALLSRKALPMSLVPKSISCKSTLPHNLSTLSHDRPLNIQ